MTQFAEVYLVGGGPGDPNLLTVKPLGLLKIIDVVVHDRVAALEKGSAIPCEPRLVLAHWGDSECIKMSGGAH